MQIYIVIFLLCVIVAMAVYFASRKSNVISNIETQPVDSTYDATKKIKIDTPMKRARRLLSRGEYRRTKYAVPEKKTEGKSVRFSDTVHIRDYFGEKVNDVGFVPMEMIS